MTTYNVGKKPQVLWDQIGSYFISGKGGGDFGRPLANPTKLGEAMALEAWEMSPNMVGPYGSVAYDPIDRYYKMWYTVQKPSDPWRYLAYAYSADGIAWIKPKLGLVTFGGTTANNIVDLRQVAPITNEPAPRDNLVFIDSRPDVPPSQRVKHVGYVYGLGVRVQVSSNGILWSDPVSVQFPYNIDSFISGGWDALEGAYVLYVRSWDDKTPQHRSVRRLVIPPNDFMTVWPTPTYADDLHPGGLLELESTPAVMTLGNIPFDIYQMGFDFYEDADAVRAAVPTLFDFGADKQNLVFAFSRNNGNGWEWGSWAGAFSSNFIPRSPSGGDSGSLYFMGRLRLGDWDYWYYSASAATHSATWDTSGRVFVAKLKKDRALGHQFPWDGRSELFIGPLVFQGNRLRLNCNLPAGSDVRCFFTDTAGVQISGFRQSDAVAINGPVDSVGLLMDWNGKANDCSALAGQEVYLVIQCSYQGTVHAFQFYDFNDEEPPPGGGTDIDIACNGAANFDRMLMYGDERTYAITGYVISPTPESLNPDIVEIVSHDATHITVRAVGRNGFATIKVDLVGLGFCYLLFWVVPDQEALGC